MNEPRRPDPPPYESDDVRTVAIGTILWGVALVALLPFWGRLDDAGRLWWIPTCASGLALGFVGLAYTRRRAAAIARDKARGTSDEGPSVEGS